MTQRTVRFYYGLGSRYSYLAASQLDRIEAETGCRFEWLPLPSGELIRRANDGLDPFEGAPTSGQYRWDFRQRDAEDWADFYGIPYREPLAFRVDPADLARACWAAEGNGALRAVSERIMRAVFIDGIAVTRDDLAVFAGDVGLDGEATVAAMDTAEVAERLEAVIAWALADGAFGVPSFAIDGRVFWGNDRLPLLSHYLSRTAA